MKRRSIIWGVGGLLLAGCGEDWKADPLPEVPERDRGQLEVDFRVERLQFGPEDAVTRAQEQGTERTPMEAAQIALNERLGVLAAIRNVPIRAYYGNALAFVLRTMEWDSVERTFDGRAVEVTYRARIEAARVAAILGDPLAGPTLRRVVNTRRPADGTWPRFVEIGDSASWPAGQAGIDTLKTLPNLTPEETRWLQERERQDDVRIAAMHALADLGIEYVVPDLIRILEDVEESQRIRVNARDALRRLTNHTFRIRDEVCAVRFTNEGGGFQQDYVTGVQRWRHWWRNNQRRSRAEWLLDGFHRHGHEEIGSIESPSDDDIGRLVEVLVDREPWLRTNAAEVLTRTAGVHRNDDIGETARIDRIEKYLEILQTEAWRESPRVDVVATVGKIFHHLAMIYVERREGTVSTRSPFRFAPETWEGAPDIMKGDLNGMLSWWERYHQEPAVPSGEGDGSSE